VNDSAFAAAMAGFEAWGEGSGSGGGALRGFIQCAGLFTPVIAGGTVFEGEELAEGFEVRITPGGDLPPGADAAGVELIAEDFFDAFDLGEIVIRDVGEFGSLLEGVLEGASLVLQAGNLCLSRGEAFFTASEAAAS
jgi:hypothetical protein